MPIYASTHPTRLVDNSATSADGGGGFYGAGTVLNTVFAQGTSNRFSGHLCSDRVFTQGAQG
ncbi:MAG: hypothetical protein GY862_39780 [Gammaproteobacteria bacterium]|nr:hypothetical protein [Gammaproteobacteria bacterium]